MDQPSVDGLNTWIISQAAARDVKAVCLAWEATNGSLDIP